MSFAREAGRAVRSTIVLWIITAIIYPFAMIAFGQLVFPAQANGSLITTAQGQVIGSELIGQPFSSERYFNSRPSAINYSSANPKDANENVVLKTGISGATNLAPSNPELLVRIAGKGDPDPLKPRVSDFERLQNAGLAPTADLVYTSGSGLDPHISIAAARAQIPRVAKARLLQPNQLETLMAQYTDSPFLGIFGEPGVNVLKLNLALDAFKPPV
jgi:K+-transporting ATPase ATPase C chain